MQLLDDPLSLILTKQMDACTLRQRVIANNIANSNTPGFKKSEVSFQHHLKEMLAAKEYKLRTTRARHISTAQRDLNQLAPTVTRVTDTSTRAGKNNVDIDEEMVNLAANSLLYNLVTRAKSDRSNLVSYVIKGGR